MRVSQQFLGRFIRNNTFRGIVKSLPLGFSDRLRSFYYRVLNYKSRLIRISSAKEKIREIQNALKSIKRMYVVYDNFCSPPTYGDYMHVIFLARYIRARGVEPTVFIITGEYRDDWAPMHDQGKTEWFVSEQEGVARFLLGCDADIRLVNWQLFEMQLREKGEDTALLFDRDVVLRKPIYDVSFNVLNILFENQAEQKYLELTLLQRRNIDNYYRNGTNLLFKRPPVEYFSLVCRRNLSWAPERNLSDEDFIQIIDNIIRCFPNCCVVCVSDSLGCSHLKALAKKVYPSSDEAILFSKDFSSSFVGDCLIVLKSKGLIQLAGGGITTPALFSDTPYLVMFDPGYAVNYRADKLTSWATRRQIFVGKPRFEVKLFHKFVTELAGSRN